MKAHGGEKYMLEMRELDRLAYTKQGSLSIEYLPISNLRLQLGDACRAFFNLIKAKGHPGRDIRNQKFIQGLGKSGQLSIRKAGRHSII